MREASTGIPLWIASGLRRRAPPSMRLALMRDMGVLDAAPGFFVGQTAQPAVAGAGTHGCPCRGAERRIERRTDMVDRDVAAPGEQSGCREQRLRILLPTQVADHDRAQVAVRLRRRRAPWRRLHDAECLGAHWRRQRAHTQFLEHDELAGQPEGIAPCSSAAISR